MQEVIDFVCCSADDANSRDENGKDEAKAEEKSEDKSNERQRSNSERDVDIDQALDYEAMDAGHSDNEGDVKEESKNIEHRQRGKAQAESSDESSGQGTI